MLSGTSCKRSLRRVAVTTTTSTSCTRSFSAFVSASLDLPEAEPLYLKIEGRGDAYGFYYGYDGQDWIPLIENADGTILSTRSAGGFVGAQVGPFAESSP